MKPKQTYSRTSEIVCDEDGEPPNQPARQNIISQPVSSPPDTNSQLKIISATRTFEQIRGSQRSHKFRRKFYRDTSASDWNDWHWQLRESIKTIDQLTRFIQLSQDEQAAFNLARKELPLRITPYYMSLLDADNSQHALRRCMIPVGQEFEHHPEEAVDPLGEDSDSPVPGLIHRYPDRVLFLVSSVCAAHCRYCTRSRMIEESQHSSAISRTRWQRILKYIAAHSEVRDVLLSGGDPLILSDDALEFLLSSLRAIPHVEMIRIGTKVPIVMPQRITRSLVRMLKKYHPLWMSIHCTHPDELTEESTQAFCRLADGGIPLGSQTVLLKGVNDNIATMRTLVHGLLQSRVRPYYLYQCDPIVGSAHFRTPVQSGLDIIAGLRGFTSGYGVPHYVIDAPGGGGKIPLLPPYVIGREGNDLLLRNYAGAIYQYPDVDSEKCGS